MIAKMKTVRAPAVAAVTSSVPPNELRIEGAPEETSEQRIAKVALGPTALNALTAVTYSKRPFGSISMQAAFGALNSDVRAVHGGDLSGAEAMLVTQASALNAIFNALAMRSHAQDQMTHLDSFLRLALKAQNQCRMTLETLATIKNPPVVFARQANISQGPQQVNNSAALGPAARAAKIETAQNELLEASHGERLDTRAAGTASGADPHMETVGAVHRAPNR